MFKFQVEELAKELFTQHKLYSWVLKFKDSVRVLGSCRRSERTIFLSNNFILVNTYEEVKKVLLHEIAHALTCGGHDYEFRKKCSELGISQKRSNTAALIIWRYIGICKKCGQKIHRQRRIEGYHCKGYDIIWHKNPDY